MFTIFKAKEYSDSTDDYFAVHIIERTITKVYERSQSLEFLEHLLTSKDVEEEDEVLAKLMAWVNNQPSTSEDCDQPFNYWSWS